jgi:hypothetical protein
MAKNSIKNYIYSMGKGIHESVDAANKSKVFAGLMIITLNIASRFVTIKLSKSMESYLKYTFSKQILVFAIAWMGTRDIYTAFVIMLALTLSIDYLFNEDSQFCILPETFTNYHRDLIDNDDDEVEKAKKVVENAETKEKKKEEMKVKEAITRNELVTLV